MTWASEAVGAIRKIVLIEDRVVANQVDQLAETCQELDRQLLRLEAKFELIERVATTAARFEENPKANRLKLKLGELLIGLRSRAFDQTPVARELSMKEGGV
jgi:hypothetical protein